MKNRQTVFKILLISALFSALTLPAQNLDKLGKKGMVTVSGGLNVNSLFYHANGIANRRDPFTWYANGNVTVNVLDVSLPFNYSYSNNQSKFTQPFNMTSFTPTYKWAKAYIGYTSMNFSQYTLAGHIFLGAGVELSPNNWKIAAMYGRLKKPVEYDAINESDLDMSYKRMGSGAKVGYEKNGYGLGITWFNAKDDIYSLKYTPANTQITPQENTVVGFNGKARITKYVSLDGEYAISGITRNLLALNEEGSTSLNKLPVIFNNKSTSQFFQAYKTSLNFGAGIFKVGLNYEHVDPDYKTLGAYFFNNDFENITVSPAISLLKNKLSVAVNTGFQKNNLDKTKLSTTKRWIGSANVTFAPNPKWNFSAGYSNFTSFTNVRPVSDPYYIRTPADTLNFYQLSQNANGTISHNFGKTSVKKAIVFTANYQVSGDKTADTKGIPNRIYTGNLSYSFNFTKTKTSLTFGANANQAESSFAKSLYAGPTIALGKGLLNNTIKTSLGLVYNWGYVNNKTNSSVINSRASLAYNPKVANKKLGKPSITLGVVYVQKLKTAVQAVSFNEFTGNLALGYSF